MKTQQFKSIDLRTIVTKLLNGQPINGVSVNQLYNLDSGDIDDDVTIVDEFTDRLQFMEYQINKREQQLKLKGGIENEKKAQNESSKNQKTPERRQTDLTEEKMKDEQLSNPN